MNLTQLLVTQQNVAEISARFGLTEEQTLEAMAAVTPAFPEGLKCQTSSPRGAAGFLEALSSGHHTQYGDHPGSAMDEDRISDFMFKSLLPALASMVMGSLFKGMTGGGRSGSNIAADSGSLGGNGSAGGGLLGQILEGLAGGQATRRRAPSRRRRGSSGLPGMFEDLLGTLWEAVSASLTQSQNAPRTKTPNTTKAVGRRFGGAAGRLFGQWQRQPRQTAHASCPDSRKHAGAAPTPY